MNTIQAIKTRKSPERFNDEPLTRDDITAIAEAGAYAPIFGKVHFTVVDDKDLIAKIDEAGLAGMRASGNDFAMKLANIPGYSAVRNAAAFVIISSKGGMQEMGFGMANVACAAENICLAATDRGIGSRFMMGPVGALAEPSIAERLAIPEGYEPLVMVALGHTDDQPTERDREVKNLTFA